MSDAPSALDAGRSSRRSNRGPLTLVLDLFSSVRLGIVLLTLLFFYATFGSAGVVYPVGFDIFNSDNWQHSFPRTWRHIELTEMEWFDTWVFNGLIGLICTNLIITTVRRIPFNALKVGVWMIHTGIIVLCIGSVVYFSQKVEGDTPVVRREVRIAFPGTDIAPKSLLALPGNTLEVSGPDGLYRFSISQIDPQWPILSGADQGKRVYSVSVMVSTPTQQFVRQMLAGFPQYTEDVIPGKGRAKKQPEFHGEAIIDKGLDLSLAFAVRDEFWVRDTSALYARNTGSLGWSERSLKGVPRFNDYLTSPDDVWSFRAGEELPIDPLKITAAASKDISVADPLAGYDVKVTGFLRYAVPRTSFLSGKGAAFPIIDVRFLGSDGGSEDARLAALDPKRATALQGFVAFRWVKSAAEIDDIARSGARTLRLRVPGMSEAVTVPVREADVDREGGGEFRPIGETGCAYRVIDIHEHLPLTDATGEVSIAVVEFKTPERTFTRWVADDPKRSKDVSDVDSQTGHPGMVEADPAIEAVYTPSSLTAVNVVAGPGDVGLWVLYGGDEGGLPKRERLGVGKSAQLSDHLAMTVIQYSESAQEVVRPMIVPREQRDRNTDEARAASMVKVEISKGTWKQSQWVMFHKYAFPTDAYAAAGLTQFEPAAFTLEPDGGRGVEVLFGQQRCALPHKIALDDFILTETVGGYATAQTAGVRDWTSVVRFSKDGTSWTEPEQISTNKPTVQDGWWYFQSYWDPPSGGMSKGLNLTGLGVGNRHGVYTQLAGCCIAVTGMIYAFYVKPIIRRRRRDRVLAEMASGRVEPPARLAEIEDEPVHVNGGAR